MAKAAAGFRTGPYLIPLPDADQPDLTAVQPRSWLPDGVSRRAVGIGVTLAIEALILLVLLSLGVRTGSAPPEVSEVTTFDAREQGEEPEAAEDEQAEVETAEETAPVTPQSQPPTAALTPPPTALPREGTLPTPPPAVAEPQPQPSPTPSATPRARAVIRGDSNFGPADTGRRGGGQDSQVVGTAPDGSPLYAARWYTEPTDQQLAGYLAGAQGPGWGQIACRTAPGWRVVDCVVVGESPQGSNMGNAVNQAAWQFLVRPPRVDGDYLVGAWVQIRITQRSGRGPGG